VLGSASASAPVSRVSDDDLHGRLSERVLSALYVIELTINY